MICGPMFNVPYPPTVDDVPCCIGYAEDGPEGCVCWRPRYSTDQADLQRGVPIEIRPEMCADCAYRPGSPERTNSDHAVADAYMLNACAEVSIFWCHDGLRSIVGFDHPDGRFFPWESDDKDGVVGYKPPIEAGVPYRADGRPALRCAGWAARARTAGNPLVDLS